MRAIQQIIASALLLLPCACATPRTPTPMHRPVPQPAVNAEPPSTSMHIRLDCTLSAQGHPEQCLCLNAPSPAICAWAAGRVAQTPFRPFRAKDGTPTSRPHMALTLNYMTPPSGDATVTLLCTITPQGRAENCRCVSATSRAFYEQAMTFVRNARYAPATVKGVPVPEFNHRLNFTFKDNDPR